MAVPSQAAGAERRLNAAGFRPGLHPGDIMGVRSTRGVAPWGWAAGTYLAYTKAPIRLVDPDTGGALPGSVDHQMDAIAYGSVGIIDRLSLGIGAPLQYTSGDATGDDGGVAGPAGAAMGDVRLSAKGRLLGGRGPGVGVAVLEELTAPTSTGGGLSGDDGLTSTSLIISDIAHRGWRVAVNGGLRLRSAVSIGSEEVGNELLFGAGGSAPLSCGVADAVVSAAGHTALSDPFGSRFTNGLDLLAGGRVYLGHLTISAAAGGGVLDGYGSPAVQGVVQLAWEPSRDHDCYSPPPAVAHQPAERPDEDGDGVPDAEDECANEAGPRVAAGCPDGDADGVADALDGCPALAGTAETEGCPDADADGVPDAVDRCPDFAGPVDSAGCGDRDEDGVSDADDRCPDVAGVVGRYSGPTGCPRERVVLDEKSQSLRILEEVRFETGRAVVEAGSIGVLEEVARMISAHPEIDKVRVEGHTDDVGSQRINLALSQNRAEAVVRQLVDAGVAPARLVALGYGGAKPIADNTSPENRARNRRVVFKVLGGSDGDTPEKPALAAGDDGTVRANEDPKPGGE